MILRFILNGESREIDVDGDMPVVDILREIFGLTGTKEGCRSGECGACTIIVDGTAKLACLMVAAQLVGRHVVTIEGLATDECLDRVQQAFVDHGAIQCGFCTPGMVIAASVLLKENPAPTRSEIRQAISGNLCRCTGYQKIVDAVHAAAQKSPQGDGP